MGNVSWLHMVMNGAEQCKINWDVGEITKLCGTYSIECLYNGIHFNDNKYEKDDKGRPKTLADLAKALHNTKFIGYLNNNYVESLQELCRILEPCAAFPRLYYEFEGWDELYCLEFYPGTVDILLSSYWFENDLKQENIPSHPEDLKKYNQITSEEYTVWEEINDKARQKVMNAAINSVDGWKPWKKLVKNNFTHEELLNACLARIHAMYV